MEHLKQLLELAEKEAEKHQAWHREAQDIEVVAISGNNYCITYSEGEELTSTIFITSNIMIDVTDSYHMHKFFKMLLITELIRRELITLTSQTQNYQYLPSGTQKREQFKPDRRRIVQRKWALPRNRHTLVEGSTTSSSHKAPKICRGHQTRAFQRASSIVARGSSFVASFVARGAKNLKSHHPLQGAFQRASLIKQSKKNTNRKTSNSGTPAPTHQAISHANFNPHAILIRQFT